MQGAGWQEASSMFGKEEAKPGQPGRAPEAENSDNLLLIIVLIYFFYK